MKKKNWLEITAVLSLGVGIGILYYHLGRDYLFDWDEAIYAELGRSIVRGASWLTPTWNGDIWLEKPPVIAWVVALGLKLVGTNEWGARLIMPLFAGLSLISVYAIGKKLYSSRMGVIAASLLGYFNLFLIRARTVNTDGILMAAITGTAALLLSGAPAWSVALVAAMGVMTKGLAGLLTVLISLPLLIKKERQFRLMYIIFFLAYVIPWHLYQVVVNGRQFMTPYLLEQVLRRATVPIEFHMESRWFYFLFLYKDLGLGMLIGVLVGLGFMAHRYLEKRTLSEIHWVAWWIVVPLGIFTLAKTRLSWYILPAYPALALSIAYGLERVATIGKKTVIMNIIGVGMLLQTLLHMYRYVEPGRSQPSPLPEQLEVAQSLREYPIASIAMLVSQSERTAEAILPADQRISSSFRYGGAPSVVWYADKHIQYYYNYDEFRKDMEQHVHQAAIVTEADADKIRDIADLAIHGGAYSAYVEKGLIQQ